MWRLGVVVACASAACLSKPEPAQPGPGDAGGEDGTSPDAPAPVGITRIGHTTGTALASAGRIQVTPPTNAESGDLVLLFIDRFNTSGAVANASGWQPISQLGVDADSQEVGYRIAGASEQTDTTSYNFPAPQDAPWVLIVYRGATFVGSTYGSGALGTDNGMGRYVFTLHDPPAQPAAGILIDSLALGFDDPGCIPTPAQPFLQTDYWKVFERSIVIGDDPPAASVSCARMEGAHFQFVVLP